MALNQKQRDYAISQARASIEKSNPQLPSKNYTEEVFKKLFGGNATKFKSALKRSYCVSDVVNAAINTLPALSYITKERKALDKKNEAIAKAQKKEMKKAVDFIMLGDAKEVLEYISKL